MSILATSLNRRWCRICIVAFLLSVSASAQVKVTVPLLEDVSAINGVAWKQTEDSQPASQTFEWGEIGSSRSVCPAATR